MMALASGSPIRTGRRILTVSRHPELRALRRQVLRISRRRFHPFISVVTARAVVRADDDSMAIGLNRDIRLPATLTRTDP